MQLLKKRGFTILIAIIIILFLTYLLVSLASQQVNWAYAENITFSESESFKAIVIRDEQVINSKNKGECYYRYYNGEKVAKGSVIAEYYSSGEQVRNKNHAETLRNEISELNKISEQNKYYSADLGTVTSQIKSQIYGVIDAFEENDFSAFYKTRTELLNSYNRRGLILGENENYDAACAEIQAKIKELGDTNANPIARDFAPSSGYFVNFIDGLEEVYDYKKITEITELPKIPEIDDEQTEKTNSTKIVRSAKSYIVFQIDKNTAAKIGDKKTISIKLPTFSNRLTVTIDAINKTQTGEYIVVLSTMSENSMLMTARQMDINVYFEEYEGLKVDINSIRTTKNDKGETQTGVYVQVGKYIKYKKVNVLYYGDEFAIIKSGESLKIKDEVVIGGNDIDERVRT